MSSTTRCTLSKIPSSIYIWKTKHFFYCSEDEVGHCVIILSTLINREPSLCAPLLPEILLTVSRVIRDTQYSWELDSNVYVPQNSRSIAKQFIRCALHQLSGNYCNMTI